MKMKKIVAVALTLSMVFGIAGCSKNKKITTDSFLRVVESYGASEVKFSKLNRVSPDDLTEGIYSEFTGEDLEDVDGYAEAAENYDFPFEAEDIVSGAIYVQASDFDVEEIEDLADAEFDMILATQITLSEDMSEDIIEYYGDILDRINVDIDDLSDEEFSEDDGRLMLNVSVEDFADRVRNLSIVQLLMAFADAQEQQTFNDALDNANGNICLGVYVNGESLVVVVGVGYGTEPAMLNTLCDDLKLPTPADVDTNEDIVDGIMDLIETEVMNSLGSFGF